MRRSFLAIFLIIAIAATGRCGELSDSVKTQLSRLDSELAIRDSYFAERQKPIDSIRSIMHTDRSRGLKWTEAAMEIGSLYNSFNIDSALYYYTAGHDRAAELQLDSLAMAFKLRRASIYPVVGFINKALQDYESIDTVGMPLSLKALYLDSGRQMYSYISAFYINYPAEHDLYSRKASEAQLALISMLPQNSPQYKLNYGEYLYTRHEFNNAKFVLEELMAELPEDDNMYARAAHFLSDIALARGNRNEYLYYLTLSAISDTKGATLEMSSLQQLGRVLFEQGDIDRAHQYLLIALDGAVKGHAVMRMIQTAESMPIIEDAHRAELDKERHRIYMAIAMLGVLVVVLIATVWFIRREMRHMAELQVKLESANQIKDIYISQFLSLCSIYMDKLNQFCKIANRKISAGQVDDLYKMTKSGKFIEEQSKEFYEVFDDAFLHIYPTFVESVNALLRPEERIELAEGEKLNTDLRILAFMRLGIEDSGKIAQVLNYSINTIYTYRNKLKNRAINRENFEADIMKISSIN